MTVAGALRAPPGLRPLTRQKATPTELQQYRTQARAARLRQRASEQIRDLRADLEADPSSASRRLLVAAYALLLLATQRAFASSRQALLPRPNYPFDK